MKRLLTFAGLSIMYLACAETVMHSSYIVGYGDQELSKGWNEIELNFDAVGAFPVFTTLDKVIEFCPPDSILGDEIVFDLDGYHQKYRIDNYDAVKKQFSLTKVRKNDHIPEQISFDWIPAPKIFWIKHVTTNKVHLIQSGLIDNNFRKIVDSQTTATSNLAQPLLKIVPVNPDATEIHYTLLGGKIIQQK